MTVGALGTPIIHSCPEGYSSGNFGWETINFYERVRGKSPLPWKNRSRFGKGWNPQLADDKCRNAEGRLNHRGNKVPESAGDLQAQIPFPPFPGGKGYSRQH